MRRSSQNGGLPAPPPDLPTRLIGARHDACGTETRARTKIIEAYAAPHREYPLVKVNPMANWSKKQMWKYIYDNEVPIHPLWELGYKSIGCKPCTAMVGAGQDERAGRWNGSKTECGIHTAQKPLNYSI